MSNVKKTAVTVVGTLVLLLALAAPLLANGGPFVLKYPGGDPAAKGVLARLDPDLRPGTETRLRVVKEDLKVAFEREISPFRGDVASQPVARVSAEYTIENPTDANVEVDFGFPILRGIYVSPLSMAPSPEVRVRMGKDYVPCTIISNSAIYGIVRQRAREAIEKAVARDPKLEAPIESIRRRRAWETIKNDMAGDPRLEELENSLHHDKVETREASRTALRSYLCDGLRWNQRDADLMVEYAVLDFGNMIGYPLDRGPTVWGDQELASLMNANLGPLAAIGEQKATQFFAQLASRFDPKAAAAYEAIFAAWGGDVRELSVDLETGKLRPREIAVDANELDKRRYDHGSDPTIYARVDYLDPQAKISEAEKASCKAILKNLPVVFTFAPMNILHYQVKFPPQSTQTLTVEYSQYAYSDTRSPASYQLAYVVHPASFWKDFGPINLEVTVPGGIKVVMSDGVGMQKGPTPRLSERSALVVKDTHTGTLRAKTGEIYLAVDADSWKKYAEQQAKSARK